MRVEDLVKFDEGLRLEPYKDSKGNWTIGYGFNLKTFDVDDAEYFLNKKISEARNTLLRYPWFHTLDVVRQAALIDLVYNVGATGFAGFKKMISAIAVSSWQIVAKELLDSEAARLLPGRYQRLAAMLMTGTWPKI